MHTTSKILRTRVRTKRACVQQKVIEGVCGMETTIAITEQIQAAIWYVCYVQSPWYCALCGQCWRWQTHVNKLVERALSTSRLYSQKCPLGAFSPDPLDLAASKSRLLSEPLIYPCRFPTRTLPTFCLQSSWQARALGMIVEHVVPTLQALD